MSAAHDQIARRVARLQARLAESPFDSIIFHQRENCRYLSGLNASYCLLLITRSAAHLMTDPRYIETARGDVRGFEIHVKQVGPPTDFYELLKKLGVKMVGLEGTLGLDMVDGLRNGVASATFESAKDIVTKLRRSKDANEVEAIVAAQRVNEDIFRKVCGILKQAGPGKMSEQQFAVAIRREILERGYEPSFDPIIAAGTTGSRPHYTPSPNVPIVKGALLVDMGVTVGGYCSDMTRMVHLGPPDEKFARYHEAVNRSRAASMAAIKPGAHASTIHQIATDTLKEYDVAGYFTHGLGHGVGMAIHEQPVLNAVSKDILEPGDIVTVEPGIYIEGWGGIRIEDIACVTDSGHRNLTALPSDLTVL